MFVAYGHTTNGPHPDGWRPFVGHAVVNKALALAMAPTAALAAASMLVRAAVSEADSLSSAVMTVWMVAVRSGPSGQAGRPHAWLVDAASPASAPGATRPTSSSRVRPGMASQICSNVWCDSPAE